MRVTDMRGVDLDLFRFDYDLTFCGILMAADGTIHHIYGGRTHTDAEHHLSIPTLIEALDAGLQTHAAHVPSPTPPTAPGDAADRHTVERIPWLARRLAGQPKKCIHCHTVGEALLEDRREKGTFQRQDIWRYPEPAELGFTVDPDAPLTVATVTRSSPAAKAGLRVGDRLRTVGADRAVRTFGDLSAALHGLPWSARKTELGIRRGDAETTLRLSLPKGWKETSAEVFRWRATMWRLRPQPGFGGRPLTADQKKAAGLDEDAFAFQVRYLITWGENRNLGRNAAQAGLRKGDIVLSVGGKSDFQDELHVQTWFRFTQTPGTTCEVRILRNGEGRTIRLPVLP